MGTRLPKDKVQLPIGPFRDWCYRIADLRYEGMAGLEKRVDYVFGAKLREQKTIGYNVVDLVVTREGSLAGVWELYDEAILRACGVEEDDIS